MTFKEIAKRVNAACNFFADTEDENYVAVLTREEILAEDATNKEMFFLFKKELGACGY